MAVRRLLQPGIGLGRARTDRRLADRETKADDVRAAEQVLERPHLRQPGQAFVAADLIGSDQDVDPVDGSLEERAELDHVHVPFRPLGVVFQQGVQDRTAAGIDESDAAPAEPAARSGVEPHDQAIDLPEHGHGGATRADRVDACSTGGDPRTVGGAQREGEREGQRQARRQRELCQATPSHGQGTPSRRVRDPVKRV